MSVEVDDWAGVEKAIGKAVESVSAETLAAYKASSRLVLEHANLERSTIEGGYGRRQLFELIQNGADELVGDSGRIEVVLTEDALYCANEGKPLTTEGIGALLFAYLSPKRSVEIGRFGLGFKSVLGISESPEIFSRSGSVRFDPVFAKERIEATLGDSLDRVPVLRIAKPLDPDAAADDDEILRGLMEWATTVVRLSRDAEDTSWLETDLRSFPGEFLLFSPHVSSLVLRDQQDLYERTISSRTESDGVLVLSEAKDETRWRIFRAIHTPSETARKDAGALTDRDEIPLAWAVETRRGRRGDFWAFFPTLDRTTLSGVVNAPWKLNEDRTRVIEGPFNDELLNEVCDVVIDNLEVLMPAEDPGLILDLLPGRGREAAGWADEELTSKVNEAAGFNPSIPDQNGELELPAALTLHPPGLPREVLDLWAASPTRPVAWCHPSVESRDRRASVDRYMQGRGRIADLGEWLEALVAEPGVEGSAAAITVAAALLAEKPEMAADIAAAKILLTTDGSLVSPDSGGIFVRAPLPIDVDVVYVDDALLEREGVRVALVALGIREVDSLRVLETLLDQEDLSSWRSEDWTRFWDLVRRSSAQSVATLLEEADITSADIAVRTLAGTYARLYEVLLPGDIISGPGTVDTQVGIDTEFHREELPLLRLLGATTAPTPGSGGDEEPWFVEFEKEALEDYIERLKESGSSPGREYLGFRSRPIPGPAAVLEAELSAATRARFTLALLNAAEDLKPWTFCHRTQAKYPERPYPNPIIWLVTRKGALNTSLGLSQPAAAVAPQLSEFRDLLPVAAGLPGTAAEALGLPLTLGDLSEAHWKLVLNRAGKVDSPRLLGKAYLAAAQHGVEAPEVVRCKVGAAFENRALKEVVLTAEDDEEQVLLKNSDPYLRVGDRAGVEALTARWGFRTGEDAIRRVVGFVQSGEAAPLVDLFPMLKISLESEQMDLQVVPCSELRLESYTDSGLSSQEQDLIVHEGALYRRDDLDDRRFLEEVSHRLGLGLDSASLESVIQNLEDLKVRDLRREIHGADGDRERLLLGIGPDALRRGIPPEVLAAAEDQHGAQSDEDLADLSLAVHGVEVLQKHREDLEQMGLDPPAQWAASRKALTFVRALGFDDAFAGFKRPPVDPEMLIEGPIELPDLHEYQEVVVGEIREITKSSKGRALLSLPTGAGKTRVAIESLVDAVLAGEIDAPILWIAQTEELCEQAVETWSEVWRWKGPRRRLTISRLWKSFNAQEADTKEQVVVATIQKLDAAVFENDDYDWLKERAGCVVVDEAHQSIGTSYTSLLRWQGLDGRSERAPLIGLTATPFRGINEEETKRLAARYGGKRLDEKALGSADAYPRLQELGILSRVDHEELDGSDLELSPAELAHLEQMRQLPAGATSKLASDMARNRSLLESIGTLDEDWPVLVFALSVQHAQMLAALLRREGISSAAVAGETDPGARRHYIEEFRSGDIRVLTNYNVLTAGFDAPKVRALYVARPTYSPNAYQQMVGRGLRGPKNGGTDRCLLVNVSDNVAQFGERLAFHEFDYLWSGAG